MNVSIAPNRNSALKDCIDNIHSHVIPEMRWRWRIQEKDICIFARLYTACMGSKAKGSGTRSLYCAVNPYCVAKSRQRDGVTLDPIPVAVDNGAEVWAQVIR